MGTDTQELTDTDRHALDKIAETIAQNTQLSERQAKSFILKEVVGMRNEEVVDYVDISSPTTVGSHVSRVRNKFKSAEDEIEELKREIDRWDNTEKLEHFAERREYPAGQLEDLRNDILSEFDTVSKYLIHYLDSDGNHRTELSYDTHPSLVNRTVIQYRRIEDVDELFE